MRRILALVLSVVMVLALPVMGFAAVDPSPKGESASSREPSGGGSSVSQDLSDGTKVETTTTADGTTISTTTADEELKAAAADVSADAAAAAKRDGKPVLLDLKVKAVPAEEEEKAPEVKVTVPSAEGKVPVEVSVSNLTNGVVVAKVMPDGSKQIVKTSTVGEKGVVFMADGTDTYVFLENSKDFTDLTADWQKSGVEFASSRELMVGTSEGHFDPNAPITGEAVATVLGRMADEVSISESTGPNWAAAGLTWAQAKGLDISNAGAPMLRSDLMIFLWKFAGGEEVEADLSGYADAANLTGDALKAAKWCVANGIIFGTSSTSLAPDAETNRAQFAVTLERIADALNK